MGEAVSSVRILTSDERQQGLGGTDVAAIVGVSTYRAPIDVYTEKRGESQPQEQTWRMRLGQIFEDAIAQAYSEQTSRRIARMGVVFDQQHPFLYVHPDRKVIGEPGLVEVKKTIGGAVLSPAWKVQALWQMALTGRLWCDVVVFGGNDIEILRVERDQELIDALIEAAVGFWQDHILAGIPPEPDGTEAYRDYLARLHEPVEEERTATPEQVLLLDELRALQVRVKADSEHELRIKNQLADQMGTATKLVAPQGSVTYRMTKASEYVVKREAKRVLRVNFKKGEA